MQCVFTLFAFNGLESGIVLAIAVTTINGYIKKGWITMMVVILLVAANRVYSDHGYGNKKSHHG